MLYACSTLPPDWTVKNALERVKLVEKLTTLISAYIEHPDHKRLSHDPSTSLRELRLQHDALIGLAMAIEDAFGITLADETIHAWATIGDIQDTIAKKLRRKEAMDELLAGDLAA